MVSSRVLVVEDDASTRKRLVAAVTHEERLQLVGAANDCRSARALFVPPFPDVILLDLGLPDGDGISLIHHFRALHPPVLCMVITVFDDEVNVVNAIRAGAVSYLLKDASATQVGHAIQDMLQGGSPITPAVARLLLRRHLTGASDHAAPSVREAPEGEPTLSAREAEVLTWVARGDTYGDIADTLGISVNTVRTHVRQIYAKLAVTSRGAAVFEALQRGLVSRPSSDV